jgi:hypothetical protein
MLIHDSEQLRDQNRFDISEIDLVFALSKPLRTIGVAKSASPILKNSVDWKKVFDVAAAFEVEPVFFSNLRALGDRLVPGDIQESAARREREARAFAVGTAMHVGTLVKKFRERHIPVIVLKGPTIALICLGDASMRTYGDVDLLVQRDAVPAARDLLISLGYVRDFEGGSESFLIKGGHALEFSQRGRKVEIHSSLLESYLRFEPDMAAIWKDAISVDCAGFPVRVLSRHHCLVFTCAHAAKHEWSRPRWISDLAILLDCLTPGEFAEGIGFAKSVHAEGLVALGLALVQNILGEIPSHAQCAFYDERWTPVLVQHVLAEYGLAIKPVLPGDWLRALEPRLGSLLFWMLARERRIDRIASLAHAILVPGEGDLKAGKFAWATRPVRLLSHVGARALRKRSRVTTRC